MSEYVTLKKGNVTVTVKASHARDWTSQGYKTVSRSSSSSSKKKKSSSSHSYSGSGGSSVKNVVVKTKEGKLVTLSGSSTYIEKRIKELGGTVVNEFNVSKDSSGNTVREYTYSFMSASSPSKTSRSVPEGYIYVEDVGYIKQSEAEAAIKDLTSSWFFGIEYNKLNEEQRKIVEKSLAGKNVYKQAFKKDIQDKVISKDEWTYRYLLKGREVKVYEVKPQQTTAALKQSSGFTYKGVNYSPLPFNFSKTPKTAGEVLTYSKTVQLNSKEKKGEGLLVDKGQVEFAKTIFKPIPIVGDILYGAQLNVYSGLNRLQRQTTKLFMGKKVDTEQVTKGLTETLSGAGEAASVGYLIGSVAGAGYAAAVTKTAVPIIEVGLKVGGNAFLATGFQVVENVRSGENAFKIEANDIVRTTGAFMAAEALTVSAAPKILKAVGNRPIAAGAAIGTTYGTFLGVLTAPKEKYVEHVAGTAVVGAALGAAGGLMNKAGYTLEVGTSRVVVRNVKGEYEYKITGFKAGIGRYNKATGKFEWKGLGFELTPLKPKNAEVIAPTGVFEYTRYMEGSAEKTYSKVGKAFFSDKTKISSNVIEKNMKRIAGKNAPELVKAVRESGGVVAGSQVERAIKVKGKLMETQNPRFKKPKPEVDLVFFSEKDLSKFGKKLGITLTKEKVPMVYKGYLPDYAKYSGKYGKVQLDITVLSPSQYSPRLSSPFGSYIQAYTYESVKTKKLGTIITYSPTQQIATKTAAVGIAGGELAALEKGKNKYVVDVKSLAGEKASVGKAKAVSTIASKSVPPQMIPSWSFSKSKSSVSIPQMIPSHSRAKSPKSSASSPMPSPSIPSSPKPKPSMIPSMSPPISPSKPPKSPSISVPKQSSAVSLSTSSFASSVVSISDVPKEAKINIPIPPPALGLFGRKLGNAKQKPSYGKLFKQAYFPSVEAAFKGIVVSSAPTQITGLEIRPLVGSAKPRRRARRKKRRKR